MVPPGSLQLGTISSGSSLSGNYEVIIFLHLCGLSQRCTWNFKGIRIPISNGSRIPKGSWDLQPFLKFLRVLKILKDFKKSLILQECPKKEVTVGASMMMFVQRGPDPGSLLGPPLGLVPLIPLRAESHHHQWHGHTQLLIEVVIYVHDHIDNDDESCKTW